MPIRPLHAFVFGSILSLSALGGCSSSGGGDASAPKGCRAECEAAGGAGAKVCGSDKKTYDSCAWDCGEVAKGVSMFPGACQADGSPAADAPADPADGDIICDYIKVNGAWQAVECADDLDKLPTDDASYVDGKGGASTFAHVTLRPGQVHALADAPAEVDHRSRYGAVKNQGKASSCTAFAMTAALEGAVTSSVGQRLVLSDMHLWSRYYTPGVGECVKALEKGGVASRSDADANGLAYDENTAFAWEQKKAAPDAQSVSKADGLAQFQVVRLDALGDGKKPTAEQMKNALASGADLFVAMFTSDAWGSPNNGVIADYDESGKGGHAVLVVGYRTISGQPYFILRNSWGSWADSGYGYVSFKTMEANVLVAAAVTIKRKSEAVAPCPSGQSADLGGTCRKICDDKTLADEAGNCGPASVSCPAGQTADAGGACVTACKAGDSSGTGYKVACGDRACVFTVDAGNGACPSGGEACTQTCPAPTCALVTKKNELGQTIQACALPNL